MEREVRGLDLGGANGVSQRDHARAAIHAPEQNRARARVYLQGVLAGRKRFCASHEIERDRGGHEMRLRVQRTACGNQKDTNEMLCHSSLHKGRST